jgi:hypothetical protein
LAVLWSSSVSALRWNQRPTGLADEFTADSIGRAKSFRQKLLTLNPNLVLIAEGHLREPRVNCLETWYHKSRDDLNLMRATTTLALTRSEGYCLFSERRHGQDRSISRLGEC